MAVLSLPLSFTNSFWSQDYRSGLEVLFKKLDQVTCFFTTRNFVTHNPSQGTVENAEIVAFIRVYPHPFSILVLDTYTYRLVLTRKTTLP